MTGPGSDFDLSRVRAALDEFGKSNSSISKCRRFHRAFQRAFAASGNYSGRTEHGDRNMGGESVFDLAGDGAADSYILQIGMGGRPESARNGHGACFESE